MASFTHYWSCETCDDMAEGKYEGKKLRHTAGEDFNRHRVLFGDQIYVVKCAPGHTVFDWPDAGCQGVQSI